jgi:mono/diheme cytochrome c family protein
MFRIEVAPARLRLARLAVCVALLGAWGCRQDMHDQPKYRGFRESRFFQDQRSARPLVEGVVARGRLRDDEGFFTGARGGAFLDAFPIRIDDSTLARGQDRFNVFCSPCHDRTGGGQGVVVRRGFKQPPSFHIDRLRTAPPGYFFNVMSAGLGQMPDYATQLAPRDRWAVVAYIRALQLSQHGSVEDVPEPDRARLDAPPAAPGQAPQKH